MATSWLELGMKRQVLEMEKEDDNNRNNSTPTNDNMGLKDKKSVSMKLKRSLSGDFETTPMDKKRKPVQKRPFQRIWSETDEIELLKGLIEFKESGHLVNQVALDEFTDFMDNRFERHFDKHQIGGKIRKMRARFFHDRKLKDLDGHKLKLFNLSYSLWENPLSNLQKGEEGTLLDDE